MRQKQELEQPTDTTAETSERDDEYQPWDHSLICESCFPVAPKRSMMAPTTCSKQIFDNRVT
jgi:hypothetical protein